AIGLAQIEKKRGNIEGARRVIMSTLEAARGLSEAQERLWAAALRLELGIEPDKTETESSPSSTAPLSMSSSEKE
ncbi:MAG: hypothetical protein NZM37_09810, partial [Sandaracinaceae bacterium]|nr:hypothetical protein [Sandaracinaceae bacterium]